MRKTLVFILLLATYFLVACSNATPEPAKKQAHSPLQSATKIRVGHLPIADCAQLYVAIEKGFLEEEGIEVDRIVLASGVKILEALASNSIDVGFSAVAPLILSKARNLDFMALTGGPAENVDHQEHAVLVKKDSPIKTPKDLEGKTIGIVAFRSIDEPFVKEWLELHGVDVSKVRFHEIRFPQMEPTLLTGQVDAVAAIEPFVTKARLGGKTRVLGYNYTEVQPYTEIASFNANRSWIQKNPKLAKRFQKAFKKATAYANEHPDEVKTMLTKYTKLSPELAKEITLPLYTDKLSTDSLDSVMQLMLKWKIMESTVKVSDLIY